MLEEDQKEVSVVDSLDVDTLFVDGIHGMQVKDGIATLNLTRHTFPAPKGGIEDPFVQVVMRLAMPLPSFIRMARWMQDAERDLTEQGAISVEEITQKDV